jgi:hypothetical protein
MINSNPGAAITISHNKDALRTLAV